MRVHAVDASYLYEGGVNEHPLFVSGLISSSPVINLNGTASLANDPTYGYIVNGTSGVADPEQMAINVADAIGAAAVANRAICVQVYGSLKQTTVMDAITEYTLPTEPTEAQLTAGVIAGIFPHSDEAARVALVLPLIIARLDSMYGGARPTIMFHGEEWMPTHDVCYNTPGAYGARLQAWYVSALANPTIAAMIAELRSAGVPSDAYALDMLLRRAAVNTLKAADMWGPMNCPQALYHKGRSSQPYRVFRNNGVANAVGVDNLDCSSWLYNYPGSVDTQSLIDDLSVGGSILQTPTFDALYGVLADTAERMNIARDRGVNDVFMFCNQGEGDAFDNLTDLESALTAAQGARMSVPVIQSASRALFGGNITVNYSVAVNQLSTSKGEFGYRDGGGNVGESVDTTPVSGDGTTAPVYDFSTLGGTPSPAPSINNAISLAAGWVEAVSGGQDSDAVANFPCPISGIVSAVLDEAALTLTITLNEASNIDDPSQIYIKTTSGTEYQSQVLLSGSDTTTLVFSVIEQVSGSALPETMSMSASVLLRTSDSLANITISNYPITVIPAGGGSVPRGGSRGSVRARGRGAGRWID